MVDISSASAGAGGSHFIISKIVVAQPKNKKFPCDVKGEVVSLHDAPRHTLDKAKQICELLGPEYRPAVILNGDGRFCIDIDGAYDHQNSQWSALSSELVTTFAGAYVEVSQSHTGLHIFGFADNLPEHRCKNIPLGLELYSKDRFIVLGVNGKGDMSKNFNVELNKTVAQFFPPNTDTKDIGWTNAPCEGSFPIADDDLLIAKACDTKGSAVSIFGNKATFKDLWERNVEALAASYPDSEREYDQSSADASLAQHLAFWTGNNCERIERLMRRSALYRDKWDKHKSYIQRTVQNAVSQQSTFYSVGAPIQVVKPEEVTVSSEPVLRSGFQFMAVSQQLDHFKGCVYVAETHRILTPNGVQLKSEQFNAMYGGYVFTLDDSHEKTTKKAWEAFTESQAVMFAKVDRVTFRPDLPAGEIIIEDGLRMVNSYVPVTVESRPGDVSRFLNHLAKNFPNANDRQILLSYMAAVVQYKGVKFKWSPLIQGVEGNGKTLYTMCLMAAVGERYSHMPPAQEIGEKFNAWLFDKIFIGVEDIYVPEQKLELIETLKPMITGERLAKRAMQTDQVMHRLCANFIFNSNHKNAVRKTINDRRFAIFYTAQQDKLDLLRDNMTGDYFSKLYDWLKYEGGFAMVTNYLENYQIPVGYNPAVDCQRAPDTSSTLEAVESSRGSVEMEILEAIDEGRTGFAGGWISSKAVDKLLKEMRAERQIPLNKRRDMLMSLGYDWHPALKDGRSNSVIMIDGGKPRLFIKQGHIHANLTNPADVVRHYAAAQGDVSAMTQQNPA